MVFILVLCNKNLKAIGLFTSLEDYKDFLVDNQTKEILLSLKSLYNFYYFVGSSNDV